MGEVSPTADAPRNVLVYVASDLVRDGLTKLPFVWALRNAYLGAQITWLAGKGKSAYAHALAPLVRGLLNEVIEDSGTGRRWTEVLRRPLRGTSLEGRHFDLILDTQRRLGTSLLLRRVPHGIFVSGAGRFVLSDRRPADRRAKPPSKVRRLLDLLELASGRPADIAGAPPPDLRHDALARALLPAGPRYIGFAPGAGGTDKCWKPTWTWPSGSRPAAGCRSSCSAPRKAPGRRPSPNACPGQGCRCRPRPWRAADPRR